MRIKNPSKSGELERKEWYFVNVAKDEMKAAFIYEYARELLRRSPAIIDSIIKSEGRQIIRLRPRGRFNYEKLIRDHVPEFVRISKVRFPRMPWQALDHEVRSKLVEAGDEPFPDDRYLAESRSELRSSVIDGEALLWANQPFVDNQYFRQTPHGLQIKFDQPDSCIIRAFAEWLPKERKRQGLPDVKYKPMTGRGGYSDRLNGLGALRLVNHYATQPKKLVNYTKQKLGYDALFQTVRELRSAAEKAEELLKLPF